MSKQVIEAEPETEAELSHGSGNVHPRHIVRNRDHPAYGGSDEVFEPEDRTLCGELWDRLGVKHNGVICQKCVDIMREERRRG